MRAPLPLLIFLALAACGTAPSDPAANTNDPPDSSPSGDPDTTFDAGGSADATPIPPDAPARDAATDGGDDDQPFADARGKCAYKAGALPSTTFGPSVLAHAIPIDTFVVVSQENRSFDHYFSQLPAYGQPDVDVGRHAQPVQGRDASRSRDPLGRRD